MIVGTWNLENLFRPGGSSGPRTDAAYRAKLEALADTVNQLDPALLGVQEIGEPAALKDLADVLDGQWHTIVSGHGDGRGIRVGYLSRHPLTELEDTDRFPGELRPVQADDSARPTARMGRGALAVRVSPGGGPDLEVVNCHLKSKLLSFPGGRFSPRDEGERARYGAYAIFRRAAEAATVRALADRLLDDQGRERPVVVLGDLNDTPGAATTQLLLGPPGSEVGTAGFARPDQGDAARLWNVAPRIPEEQRYSRIHAGRRELIDHVLVSHTLLDRIEEAGTGTGTGKPELPSVGDEPSARRDSPGSDHAPVWVRLAD